MTWIILFIIQRPIRTKIVQFAWSITPILKVFLLLLLRFTLFSNFWTKVYRGGANISTRPKRQAGILQTGEKGKRCPRKQENPHDGHCHLKKKGLKL